MKHKSEQLIERWKSRESSVDIENKEYLQQLKSTKTDIRNEQARVHDEVFKELDCLHCANCCKTTPPIYTTKDVRRIAQYMSISPKRFKRKYTIEDIDGSMVGIQVPCTFLNEDNTCSIYEVRPLACRTYPHTDDIAFSRRPDLNYKNTLVCPAAYHIVERLKRQIHSIKNSF